MSLTDVVSQVCDEFKVSDSYMAELAHEFVKQADDGLKETTKRGMPMIPTFLTKIPTGREKGTFLAADLGGSNFRICSVKLNGDETHQMEQMKWAVPHEKMRGAAAPFWDFLAECVAKGVMQFHPGACDVKDPKHRMRLGFTFSFPTSQTSINHGTLIRWTKGYSIEEAVGSDVCTELQKALDKRGVPVSVSALTNDTTGCLLARAYETGPDAQTLAGMICGTGTNAAYSEKISRIDKLDNYEGGRAHYRTESNIMVINTEWGSFDNDLKVLPNTKYDKAINLRTPNPDFHMFEKRVSGMFLGEIARSVLDDLVRSGKIFADVKVQISQAANLYAPWSTDTSFLSNIANDTSSDLDKTKLELQKLGVPSSTLEERKAVKTMSHAVALRSARLVASVIAGLLIVTKGFDKFKTIDIGADGAVIEFYPGFQELIIESLRHIPEVGDKASRVQIGISKDGSGIGAALCAAMAPDNMIF